MNLTDLAAAEGPQFSIVRVFDAPREPVWRAWTDASELAQWLHLFEVSTSNIAFDVRVGGRYRYTMTDEETGEQFPTGGEYLEVDPFDRLVFTWGIPTPRSRERRSSRSPSSRAVTPRNSSSICSGTKARPVTASSTTAGTRRWSTSGGTSPASSWAEP